jgi:hypothetical protein
MHDQPFGAPELNAVYSRLRELGVDAHWCHSGGGNEHITLSLEYWPYVMIDANEGTWRIGCYPSEESSYAADYENDLEYAFVTSSIEHDAPVEWAITWIDRILRLF